MVQGRKIQLNQLWYRLKALLHCAIFRATCLATPFLQTFSRYETSCFTGVTLSNASCNVSRFDDHMRLKKHFHWPVPQTVRHKLQNGCYTAPNA